MLYFLFAYLFGAIFRLVQNSITYQQYTQQVSVHYFHIWYNIVNSRSPTTLHYLKHGYTYWRSIIIILIVFCHIQTSIHLGYLIANGCIFGYLMSYVSEEEAREDWATYNNSLPKETVTCSLTKETVQQTKVDETVRDSVFCERCGRYSRHVTRECVEKKGVDGRRLDENSQ